MTHTNWTLWVDRLVCRCFFFPWYRCSWCSVLIGCDTLRDFGCLVIAASARCRDNPPPPPFIKPWINPCITHKRGKPYTKNIVSLPFRKKVGICLLTCDPSKECFRPSSHLPPGLIGERERGLIVGYPFPHFSDTLSHAVQLIASLGADVHLL